MQNHAAGLVVVDYAPRSVAELWDCGLTSSKPEIREASKSAIESCLKILPPEYQSIQAESLLGQAIESMTSYAASAASLHGSVLACTVLTNLREDFDRELRIIWPAILKVKEKDGYVSRACMGFMAVAAARCPEQYQLHWRELSLPWLIEGTKKEKVQNTALSTLARILPVAGLAGHNAAIYIGALVQCIHDHLLQPGQHAAAIELIGGSAQAFGTAIELPLRSRLDAVFSAGLSKALVNAMQHVVANIPGLATACRDRLLDAIATVLAGSSYAEVVFPAATKPSHTKPSHSRRASTASVTGLLQATSDQQRKSSAERKRASSFLDRARGRSVSPHRNAQNVAPPPPAEVSMEDKILALDSLAAFDLGSQPMLTSFVLQAVVPLSEVPLPDASRQVEIRKVAVTAVAKHLASIIANGMNGDHSTSVTGFSLLRAVLDMAVADPDVAMREHALALCTAEFDCYLVSESACSLKCPDLIVMNRLTRNRWALLPVH